jgi:hypothetical protein
MFPFPFENTMLRLLAVTIVCLSFHPMAKEHVHALKGRLAASVWLRLARLPPPASRVRRSSVSRQAFSRTLVSQKQ